MWDSRRQPGSKAPRLPSPRHKFTIVQTTTPNHLTVCAGSHNPQRQRPSAMATTQILLPGDVVSHDQLPNASSTRPLTLGPGIRLIPPATITSTLPGALHADARKSALWIDNTSGRYLPSPGDLVIATVHHSSADLYHCAITPYTAFATLPQLAFEGATKKTRPQLSAGSLVYVRVAKADKWSEVELECVSGSTGKSEGLGPLKGGMVFDVSLSIARRLMMSQGKGAVVVLEELGEKMRFEVAVGRNGKLWVESGSVRETIAVGRSVQLVDEKRLDVDEQRKLCKKVIKDLGA
ncbi:exosome non-catalytic core subunit rrp40 [Elasticomyces elasticus]|nr:exosome non-catalytic core subunit rrp40 [Elasticomyces elasticus]